MCIAFHLEHPVAASQVFVIHSDLSYKASGSLTTQLLLSRT